MDPNLKEKSLNTIRNYIIKRNDFVDTLDYAKSLWDDLVQKEDWEEDVLIELFRDPKGLLNYIKNEIINQEESMENNVKGFVYVDEDGKLKVSNVAKNETKENSDFFSDINKRISKYENEIVKSAAFRAVYNDRKAEDEDVVKTEYPEKLETLIDELNKVIEKIKVSIGKTVEKEEQAEETGDEKQLEQIGATLERLRTLEKAALKELEKVKQIHAELTEEVEKEGEENEKEKNSKNPGSKCTSEEDKEVSDTEKEKEEKSENTGSNEEENENLNTVQKKYILKLVREKLKEDKKNLKDVVDNLVVSKETKDAIDKEANEEGDEQTKAIVDSVINDILEEIYKVEKSEEAESEDEQIDKENVEEEETEEEEIDSEEEDTEEEETEEVSETEETVEQENIENKEASMKKSKKAETAPSFLHNKPKKDQVKEINKDTAKKNYDFISKNWKNTSEDIDRRFLSVKATVEKILESKFAKYKKALEIAGMSQYKGLIETPLKDELYKRMHEAGIDADLAYSIVEGAFDNAAQKNHESMVEYADEIVDLEDSDFIKKYSSVAKENKRLSKLLQNINKKKASRTNIVNKLSVDVKTSSENSIDDLSHKYWDDYFDRRSSRI